MSPQRSEPTEFEPGEGQPSDSLPGGFSSPAGLSGEEWSRTDRAARRLHSELGSFLKGFPPSARHASALSRHLDVDRTTCQRAVQAVNLPYPGPELLMRLPGVRALRMLAEAATRTSPPLDAEAVDGLVAAIDGVHALVSELGGSMSRLSKRLVSPRSQPGGASGLADTGPVEARRRLCSVATEITGRSSACWVAVYAYRPSPTDPNVVEVFRANGLVGHVARADAVPLVVHNFSTPAEGSAGEGRPSYDSLAGAHVAGRSPTVVLDEFSSQPLPLVTARQPDEFLVQAVDDQASTTEQPVDLMLATRTTMPHPQTQDPPVEEVWAMMNFPSRRLLFDVWLHRDLARRCVPSLDTHLWGPDFAQHVGDRWQTRFADSPMLQLLGSGLPRHSPSAYPRLNELTAHMFDSVQLDADEFVGHRCDVAYPLWRTGYRMRLDYTPPSSDEV